MLLAFIAVAMPLCQHLHAQKLLVIANPAVSASDVSAADLRDVFTGSSTSLHGKVQVAPVLLKDGPTHAEMLTTYIGKSDSAFRATWRSLVFSGQGVMPRSVESESSLVDFVAHTPGAIGYIARSTPHDRVKVLAVH